jgi:diguanylate cyclase
MSDKSNLTPERLRERLDQCMNEKADLVDKNRRLSAKAVRHEKSEHELLKRFYLDEKTGFPNHAYLDRDCRQVFAAQRAVSPDDRSALIFIALDETFEVLRKSQVSIISEWVLYKVAHWIRAIIADTGKVYHSQSTEFAVVLHSVESEEQCSRIVQRIATRMSEIHRFPGHHIAIGCHIGCAVYPDHGGNAGDMLRSADIALSECKKTNRSWAVFDPSMETDMMERIDLKNGILRALEQQAMDEISSQFELYFQPLVKVTSLNGNGLQHRVIGSECLLRWNHPEIGSISPRKFIPLAEESGLIIPIGNWVLYNATRKLTEFQKAYSEPLYMSINLSPKQFHDPYLIENIQRVIKFQGVDPGHIQLEITETSVMDDPEDAKSKFETIRDLGVRLSIDDFGTGYSSLSYLKNLEIDCLKIDKSFIEDVVTNGQNQGIVKAVISMARSLGMDILAEGVEEFDQLEFVHSEGCNQIQGHYFSEALPAEAFVDYLGRN